MLPLLLLLSTTQDPGADFYEAKVRPLFAEHCTKCHGETKQRAELRLDKYGSIMIRSEEHTSELRHVVISYAVFCLKKKQDWQDYRTHQSSR